MNSPKLVVRNEAKKETNESNLSVRRTPSVPVELESLTSSSRKAKRSSPKNMAQFRTYFLIYILAVFSLEVFFRIAEAYTRSYTRAHVSRLHSITKYEAIMILLTLFAWKRIMALLEPTPDERTTLPKTYKPPLLNVEAQRRLLRLRRMAAAGMLVFFAFAHLSYYVYYFQPSNEFGLYAWFCWLSLVALGVYSHLAFFLFGFSIVNFLTRAAMSVAIGNKLLTLLLKIPGFKLLLTNSRAQTMISLGVTAFLSLFGLYVVHSGPIVKEVNIPLPRLAKGFDGFRIVLLTDIHLGPSVTRQKLVDVVEIVNKLNADAIMIGGDLVDGGLADLRYSIEPLVGLKSKYGAFFSTGNHEGYFSEIDPTLAYLESIGITVLINNSTMISPKAKKTDSKTENDKLCIAGADDISFDAYQIPGHGMDLAASVRDCAPKSPRVLLAHNPTSAKTAVDLRLDVDLILSGHLHGGQVYFGAPIIYLISPFFAGLYRPLPETFVYVSTGVYYFGYPMKIYSFCEISLLTLRSDASSVH